MVIAPIESYAAMVEANKYARAKKGPVLVHAHTTRPYSHSLSDDQSMYRTQKELERENKIDVINSYPQLLIDAGFMSQKEVDKLTDEMAAELRQEMKRAVETPWPSKESSTENLYSNEVDIGGDRISNISRFFRKRGYSHGLVYQQGS